MGGDSTSDAELLAERLAEGTSSLWRASDGAMGVSFMWPCASRGEAKGSLVFAPPASTGAKQQQGVGHVCPVPSR